MPYPTNQDLPQQIKGLPEAAQTIWRKTFNNALKSNNEDSARKIAWSAVKRQYKKAGERWSDKNLQSHF